MISLCSDVIFKRRKESGTLIMVWLKPYVLITARFTFHPSKVSISFTVLLARSCSFAFSPGSVGASTGTGSAAAGALDCVPASQAAVPVRRKVCGS